MSAHRAPLRQPIVVTFDVAGRPIPQGSKTIAHGRFLRDDNAATLQPWRMAVAAAAADAMGDLPTIHGPVRLRADFRFPRPRGHYGTGGNADRLKPSAPVYMSGRPDLDKLLRAIGDGITGIVVVDDAQIVAITAAKAYGQAGAIIRIEEVLT
jgi:Holliday junction resolvase RusA-like endonuclease